MSAPLSRYVSGRDIGDEYRYILERKLQKTYPGNMLTRPGLLLNPWAVRKTDTGIAEAKAGAGYAARSPGSAFAAAPCPAPQAGSGASPGEYANLDFLPHGAVVMTNLRPDDAGVVRIARAALGVAHELRVLAIDPVSTLVRHVALAERVAQPKDLRLVRYLDPQAHFTERKQTSIVRAGESLTIDDVTTCKLESYDTIGRVHRLYCTLTHFETLTQFGFVARWHELSTGERRELYSRYACHELSFFLSRKDPAFFQEVIAPYLRNKKAKTFLDRYLLGDDLSEFVRPWAYGRLNVVERILLGKRIASDASPMRRHVSELVELIAPDVERDNRLFHAAIAGSALEAEDAFGMQEAAGLAMDDEDRTCASVGGPAARAATAAMMRLPAPGAPAAAMPPPPPAMAQRKRSAAGPAKSKSAIDADGEMEVREAGFSDEAERDVLRREEVRELYRKIDSTEELAENHYYRLTVEQQGPDLVKANAFWLDFALHQGPEPFVSPHFALATGSFTEVMLALAVLDLPLTAIAPAVVYEGAKMTLGAKSAAVVLHKEIKPATECSTKGPVLVSQSYFRSDDRYCYDGGEQLEKYVSGEFLVHVVYVCQVVVTNPTASPQKLDLLLQIPAGAVCVSNGLTTKGMHVRLEPHGSTGVQYAFYFPVPGDFPHYPVHVAKNEQLVASAEPVTLRVVQSLSTTDCDSWPWVSQNAAVEQVLDYLERNNIERLELGHIAWRMRERPFYERVIELLARRHKYSDVLWSYSLHHNDLANLHEYLAHQDPFLRGCGLSVRSVLIDVDPVVRGWYEHREYAPLVNARAHALRGEHKILNNRFAEQYVAWLRGLCFRTEPTDDDWLEAAYYLLLQDRVAEGINAYRRVDRSRISTQLQHDYLQAYVAFFEEQPEQARRIAEVHRAHPVDRWRKLFGHVLSQLDELQGRGESVIDQDDKVQRQGKLASTEPGFELTVDGQAVTLSWQNLTQCFVNYYLMDIELLFSRQPFVQQGTDQFAFITPNRSQIVQLPAGQSSLRFELPSEYVSANLVVEVVANGTRKSQPCYANDLLVHLVQGYGEVHVRHRTTGAPIPKSYVKCYARMNNQSVRFYKDGYTDLRGRFDFAGLSTSEIDQVERFAVLVVTESLGAAIREVAPPKR